MTTNLDPVVEFREDHRQVRDTLLQLSAAAQEGDLARSRDLLGKLDGLTGPHFRYEEEALYPAMKEFLGEYVDQLITEHDKAISTARVAADMLGRPSLSADERSGVSAAAKALLVHVSNCDGLNILTERLAGDRIAWLADRFAQARAANVPLLQWAETIRERKVA